MKIKNRKFTVMGIMMSLVLILAACGNSGASSSADKPTIVVGSKNFTEQFILGELYSQLLAANGYNVEKKLNLAVAFDALNSGEIDLYPEYTGTSLYSIIKGEASNDENAVYEAVKKGYKDQFNIETLDATPFNNTYVFVVKKETADQYGLKTLSDLSAKAPELNFGIIPEFEDRSDGLLGLQQEYGGFKFKTMKQFDIGLKYTALTENQVDVTIGFGTDGQIAGYDLVALEDDKNFWPPYHAAPEVRAEVLEKNPEISGLLNKLNALLTDQVMASLNWEVDGPDKAEAEDVAKKFLEEQGLIK